MKEREREREEEKSLSDSDVSLVPFSCISHSLLRLGCSGRGTGYVAPGVAGKQKPERRKDDKNWNRVMRPVIAGMSWRGGWKGAINDRALMNSCLYAFDRVLSDTAFAYTQYQSR